MNKFWKKLIQDARGATLIEYILIAGIICIVMFVGLNKIGTGYKDIYNRINNSIRRAETVKPETKP